MHTHSNSSPARRTEVFHFQRKDAEIAKAAETFRCLFALKGKDVSGSLKVSPGRSLTIVLLVMLLTSLCRADESRSPYATWPDEGMRPAIDREAQLAEIHPQQAEWINAAYAGYGYRDDAHCRAGCPECIHARALPSDTGRYVGYLVGGGSALRGETPYLDEGTWGWDYSGHFFQKHVALNWWRTRYQGGAGQYRTDGPKLRHE